MKRKNRKKKESCRLLSEYQMEQLARYIIQGTGQAYRYGTEKRKRIAAPSGAVIIFKYGFLQHHPRLPHKGLRRGTIQCTDG